MDEQQEQKFQQMTTEPVGQLIGHLALPCIISMLVTAFYNMADTFFVGMLKSNSATGAVGVVRGIPWPCSPSAAITWPTTGSTGWTWGKSWAASPQDFQRQLVPHRRGREVPLARLRGQPTGVGVDLETLLR